LLTGISDTQAGNFSAYYDGDGRLIYQFYPGTNFVASYTYDEAGEMTNLSYTGLYGGTWPTFDGSYNIHGERTTETGVSLDNFSYTYDPAGRLTQTNESQLFDCVQRNYVFDADTNRTQLSTNVGGGLFNPTPCPPQGTPTVKNAGYDAADRITTTGYGYDAFGHTTSTPAADSPSGFPTTLGYYTNDLVNTIAANGTTLSYNLDPNRHVRTWSSTADGQTHTNHYATDGDVPAWTVENTAGTNWTRNIGGFTGLGANVDQTGAVTLQLVDLHGDIFSTIPSTTTDWGADFAWNGTDEYGNPDSSGPPVGSRYDYLGSHERLRDTNSGLQLMGQRVYNPNTGRFLQTDPVLGGSANNYDYVNADPVNGTDLNGSQGGGNYGTPVVCINEQNWANATHKPVRCVATGRWMYPINDNPTFLGGVGGIASVVVTQVVARWQQIVAWVNYLAKIGAWLRALAAAAARRIAEAASRMDPVFCCIPGGHLNPFPKHNKQAATRYVGYGGVRRM
jgi:RHS repeat-associated protein